MLWEEVGPGVEPFGTEDGPRSPHACSGLEARGLGVQRCVCVGGELFRSAPVEGAADSKPTLAGSGQGSAGLGAPKLGTAQGGPEVPLNARPGRIAALGLRVGGDVPCSCVACVPIGTGDSVALSVRPPESVFTRPSSFASRTPPAGGLPHVVSVLPRGQLFYDTIRGM